MVLQNVDTRPPPAPSGVYPTSPTLLCYCPQIYLFNTVYWSK